MHEGAEGDEDTAADLGNTQMLTTSLSPCTALTLAVGFDILCQWKACALASAN